MTWLAVAIGGSLGALSRYWITVQLPVEPGKFPWATLFANVLGCLLMGLCYVVIVERAWLDATWRALLMTGFLGAMTTFSTFALDALILWQHGEAATALIYIIVSLVGCIAAISASVWLMSRLF